MNRQRATVILLALLVLAMGGLFWYSVRMLTRADFPDLSKFEVKVTCHDDDIMRKMKIDKVEVIVMIFLRYQNEAVPNNELVTLITFPGKTAKFAARWVLRRSDSDSEPGTEMRHIYRWDGGGWREMSDNEAYMAEVISNAPRKYLHKRYAYYADDSEPDPNTPIDDVRGAYLNLLYNSGCSLHGPVG